MLNTEIPQRWICGLTWAELLKSQIKHRLCKLNHVPKCQKSVSCSLPTCALAIKEDWSHLISILSPAKSLGYIKESRTSWFPPASCIMLGLHSLTYYVASLLPRLHASVLTMIPCLVNWATTSVLICVPILQLSLRSSKEPLTTDSWAPGSIASPVAAPNLFTLNAIGICYLWSNAKMIAFVYVMKLRARITMPDGILACVGQSW